MIYTYGRDFKYRPVVVMNMSKVDFSVYSTDEYFSAINSVLNVVIEHMFVPGKI